MSFDKALDFVLEREGGFVHDPDDPGGATHSGVTQATYDLYRTEDLRSVTMPVAEITPDEVSDIYRRRYWLASRSDLVPWPLYLVHFDCAVNMGVTQSVRFLQRVAGTTVDGVVGPMTMQAIARVIEQGLVYDAAYEYIWLRLDAYRRIAQDRPRSLKFLPGWIRRLQHVRNAVRQ